ncbi:transglutaminase-like cysteine peptidase [Rhodoferax sp. GW822-FHT02A01]|uniref:transglutaminase-like cysteine peptidase n=1 Tax=Rhodoferax sp. GW822-FHT02A01 TaxID=3141537 RepID=UPI00315D4227
MLMANPLTPQCRVGLRVAVQSLRRVAALRALRWSLAAALLAGLFALGIAAPDFDRMLMLAQQQYGANAAQTVAAWRKLIEESANLAENDKLNKVNTFFNRRILYKTDMEVYKVEDYWATPLEFMGHGAGDCEDFVIAKYMTLRALGVPNERLRLVYVRYQTGNTAPIAHMVLGYYAQPTEEPVILDNMVTSIRPASMRTDLTPVYSFNSDGLWVGGATTSSADPTTRLSRWRDVLERMRQDGL